MTINCRLCNKPIEREPSYFKGKKNIFCSVACKCKFYSKRFNMTCAICNKTMTIGKQQNNRNKSRNFFCSRNCYYIYIRSIGEKTNCETCGKTIPLHIYAKKRNKHHFCSKACQSIFIKNSRVKIVCRYCGKTFEVCKSKPRHQAVVYCSRVCKYKDISSSCAKCGRKIKRKLGDSVYCKKCNNEIRRKYYIKNKDKKSDGYIKLLLNVQTGIPRREIPTELIDLKRLEIEARHLTTIIKQKCDTCGKEIDVRINKIIKYNKHFCSKNCFKKRPLRSIKIPCEYCGKESIVSPVNQTRHKHHFCSNECHFNNIRVERLRKKCFHCDKDIVVPKYQVRKKNFCSRSCKMTNYWQQRKEVKNGNQNNQ